MSLDVYLTVPSPVTRLSGSETNEVYSANITHNLNEMAKAAGLYECIWRPEEVGVTKAGKLVAQLAAGLSSLVSDPAKFKAMNPAKGRGSYAGLVAFVTGYAIACAENPDADVTAFR